MKRIASQSRRASRMIEVLVAAAVSASVVAAPGAAAPSPLHVQRQVIPDPPFVGEPATLRIVVEGRDAASVNCDPQSFDGATTWILISKNARSSIAPDRRSKSFEFDVLPVYPGRQPLGHVTLRLGDRLTTQCELEPVQVSSRLRRDEETTDVFSLELDSPDEELEPLPWMRYGPAVAGICLALGLLAVGYLLWRRRPAHGTSESVLAPDELALSQLEQLQKEGLIQQRRIKEFYSRLSDTLRGFIGTIFSFDGLECTTSELMERLAEQPVPRQVWEETRKLLEEADLVKFAKYRPEGSVCEKALERARSLVVAMRPLVGRSEQGEGGGAAE